MALLDVVHAAVSNSHGTVAVAQDVHTEFLAAGRPKGEGPSERRSARVDRQVDELRVAAVEADAPASFLKTLDDTELTTDPRFSDPFRR